MDIVSKAVAEAGNLQGSAGIAAINRVFRDVDESGKWPVSGRFNATERAIRRLRRAGYDGQGLEYATTLDAEIGRVVNEAGW